MNCTDVQKSLIFDTVDGPHAAAVLAHLHRCPDCAHKADSLRRIMALLDEWTVPELSFDFLRVLADKADGAFRLWS
jgi:hypothetical protein